MTRGRAILKGISPLVSPDMLKYLSEMGHGDTFIISDRHNPAHSTGQRVVRADGSTGVFVVRLPDGTEERHWPAKRFDHIRMELDTEGLAPVADGSDGLPTAAPIGIIYLNLEPTDEE